MGSQNPKELRFLDAAELADSRDTHVGGLYLPDQGERSKTKAGKGVSE